MIDPITFSAEIDKDIEADRCEFIYELVSICEDGSFEPSERGAGIMQDDACIEQMLEYIADNEYITIKDAGKFFDFFIQTIVECRYETDRYSHSIDITYKEINELIDYIKGKAQ